MVSNFVKFHISKLLTTWRVFTWTVNVSIAYWALVVQSAWWAFDQMMFCTMLYPIVLH